MGEKNGNNISLSQKQTAKEIEVIEVEYENYLFSDNERVVRRNFQVQFAHCAKIEFSSEHSIFQWKYF